MSSDLNKDGEGMETVGQKLDTLSASVDQRFDAVDQRFDAVDQRFDAVDQRFDAVDKRFDTLSASVDERFATLSASVDERFDAVDVALVEQRQYTEFAFDRLSDGMKDGFDGVESRFNRLERKLDQFIDTQSTTNKLVERRLTALEPRSAQE